MTGAAMVSAGFGVLSPAGAGTVGAEGAVVVVAVLVYFSFPQPPIDVSTGISTAKLAARVHRFIVVCIRFSSSHRAWECRPEQRALRTHRRDAAVGAHPIEVSAHWRNAAAACGAA